MKSVKTSGGKNKFYPRTRDKTGVELLSDTENFKRESEATPLILFLTQNFLSKQTINKI